MSWQEEREGRGGEERDGRIERERERNTCEDLYAKRDVFNCCTPLQTRRRYHLLL